MHNVIIASVKPKYIEQMQSGLKEYEFRRTKLSKKVRFVVLYSTAPVSAIVATAEVEAILVDSPEAIWDYCGAKGGINKQDFFEYYKGALKAYAIKLHKISFLREPVQLCELGWIKRPPQSFMYMPITYLDSLVSNDC